jgi:hypothetical protein
MTEPATQGPTGGGKPKVDPLANFKAMQASEKMLAIAALAVLLGFIFSNHWNWLFKYHWFTTTAFLGSVLVLAVIVLELFGVRWIAAQMRTWILIGLAALPALGYVIDMLSDFWRALMLAGAVVMIVAAVRISTREGILHR